MQKKNLMCKQEMDYEGYLYQMNDDDDGKMTVNYFSSLSIRVIKARWVLIAVLAVFGWLVLSGTILFFVALAGFSLIALAVIVMPSLGDKDLSSNTIRPDIEQLREGAMYDFADVLSDPCLILDQKSALLHANIAYVARFGRLATGDPIALSLRNPTLLKAIEDVINTGSAQRVEIHQTVLNETWFDVTLALFGSRNSNGAGASHIIIIMRDLTEQKRTETMRVDFIANVSHELRTPLTSLAGFVETMQGPAAEDPEARERFLFIMGRQAGRMSKLIDDLLSLSRIELREHVRPTGKVDLGATISSVVEGLQNQAREAGIEVKFSLPDSPAIIGGDRDELFEVFENLIDNAIKYGAGGKKVEIRLDRLEDNIEFDYSVNISDFGVGIASEHVPRLTERFYRVDAETSRKKKGTGLGLAIVKHILNRHSASLSIRSKLGEGTNVEVLLKR